MNRNILFVGPGLIGAALAKHLTDKLDALEQKPEPERLKFCITIPREPDPLIFDRDGDRHRSRFIPYTHRATGAR